MADNTKTTSETPATPTDAGAAQPEAAAAMTGHQVWTRIHTNNAKAAEPEAAPAIETEVKAATQPDDLAVTMRRIWRSRYSRIERSRCVNYAVCGRALGVDASTLEANVAMRSLERRDTGQSYQDFLSELAKARSAGCAGW